MQELFDLPESYEAMLQKGIGLTGNDRHFFIIGRFDYLQKIHGSNFAPAKILDFGCGTGDASAELARRFPDAKIFGYDPADKALEYARNKHKEVNVQFCARESLNEHAFDLIFMNCVIHHIDPLNRQEIVSEITKLLSRNGKIWIFENNPANPGTRWAMYRNPFDKGVVKVWPGELQRLFIQSGLQILGKGFLFYFPQWLAWFRPLEAFLHTLPLGGQYAIWAGKTDKDQPT
jgi:SAM-dependent methyltransferase